MTKAKEHDDLVEALAAMANALVTMPAPTREDVSGRVIFPGGYRPPWDRPHPIPDTSIPVQEIHDAFDHAAENLVKKANEILADSMVKRAYRLRKLGFLENPDVKVANNSRFDDFVALETIALLIAKYRELYGKKFITLDLAKELAKKYGLIIGEAKQLRRQVPEENLVEMEEFMEKVAESGAPPMPAGGKMMVVAPYDNFATAGYVVRDSMLEYCPIVLWPVEGGYLIVTAWGAEAKDPIVVD